MAKVHKKDLVKEVAKRSSVAATTTGSIIDSLLAVITEHLQAGEVVSFPGFGSLSVRHRKGRVIRNSLVGERTLPDSKHVGFTTSGKLKEKLQ